MSDYRNRLIELEKKGMLRSLVPMSGRRGGYLKRDGCRLVNLSSNDYLGLVGNETLLDAFYEMMPASSKNDFFGLGVASSRLLTGDYGMAHTLEDQLGFLYNKRSCLLFNSGYHANIGIIPALFGRDDLICSDKLNHASLHDGLRITRAASKRYNHRDYEHLRRLLEKYRGEYKKAVIVTESIFSMDGDCADLKTLVELKQEYDCSLYVDEAHGIGLYGDKGLGLAEQYGLIDAVDYLVGTFGKACGSIGAFLICNEEIHDYLVNHSRSLIFTTALPPVVLSWNSYVMDRIPTMSAERSKLAALSERLRTELRQRDLETRGETNIVPILIGDAEKTVRGARMLQEEGFLVMPVRPPTVPPNSSRYRISLTADLTWEQIEALPRLIQTWLHKDLS